MRFRWTTFPVVAVATLGLTATAAFGATIMVDSDGAATPTSCAAGAPGSAYTTIQAGVNAAAPGDRVKVCGEPAPYAGAVVNKSVQLIGVANPVVTQAGGTGLSLQADNISVKRFELTGNATGIATSSTFSGYNIANNNIHNNTNGIQLDSSGALPTSVTRNTISDNTNAGINSATLSHATIGTNVFAGNSVFGIILSPTGTDTAIAISGNKFSGGGHSDIVFNGTVSNSNVTNNVITDAHVASTNAAAIYVGGASQNDKVANNTVTNANDFGIWVQSTAPNAVTVRSNKVTNSLSTGINFDATTSANAIVRNVSSGSGGLNCNDSSTGSGTAGTANTWVANHTAPSNPTGICT
jgi:parallel beta-helix repeat protein